MCIIPLRAAFATFSKLLLVNCLLMALSACEDDLLIYAGKQGIRQGSLIIRAKNNEKLLKDPNTPEDVKHYLSLNKEILEFAEKELKINTGTSYRKYIQLNRDWVTQIVIAAKKNALEIEPFTFPIVGEVPYKGFFDEDDAIKEETKLKNKGLDVYRRGAPAYSSLGWFSDPLYNTMFKSDAYFVELILHELVHLNFYFESMADFNEAFATWFSSKLSPIFIKQSKIVKKTSEALKELNDSQKYDEEAAAFSSRAIDYAKKAYAQKQKREDIFKAIEKLRLNYPRLAKSKPRRWNNARILSLSTYYNLVPHIERYAAENDLTPIVLLKRLIKEEESLAKKITSPSR